MAQYDIVCKVCGHYDHFKKVSSLSLFDSMCWTGKYWDINCKCKKYVGGNLEYLEWCYDKKNKKSL